MRRKKVISFFYLLLILWLSYQSLMTRSFGRFLPIWKDTDPYAHIVIKYSFGQFIEGITVFWQSKLLRVLFYAAVSFCIGRTTKLLTGKDSVRLFILFCLLFMAIYEGFNLLFNGADRTLDLYYLLFNSIGILIGGGISRIPDRIRTRLR